MMQTDEAKIQWDIFREVVRSNRLAGESMDDLFVDYCFEFFKDFYCEPAEHQIPNKEEFDMFEHIGNCSE